MLQGGHQGLEVGHRDDHVWVLPDRLVDPLEQYCQVCPVGGHIDPVVLVDLGDHLLEAADEVYEDRPQERLTPVRVGEHLQHVVVQTLGDGDVEKSIPFFNSHVSFLGVF